MITECLPEMKLCPLKESDIAMQGYQIFSNIDETSNRGVALYLSDKFHAKRLDYSTTDSSLECLFVEIKLNEKDNLVCGVVYRSPSKDNHESLRRLISKVISDRQHDQILIIGDLNHPDINWENHLSNTDEEHPASRFLKLTDDCFLTQHVNKSTRHRHNQTSNCLDLILTNDENSVQKLLYNDPLGSSDHLTLEFQYIVEIEESHNHNDKSERFSYDYGDYDKLRSILKEIDWKKEFKGMSTEAMMNYFESKLSSSIDQCIPKHKINPSKNKEKQPIWLNNHAMRALKKKHNAYKRWIITKNGNDYIRYRRHCNKVKTTIRNRIKEIERNIAVNIKTNNKHYWRYANSKLKTKSRVPDLKVSDSRFADSEQEKVDVLNQFFTSVFTREDLSSIPQLEERQFASPLTDINITEELVLNALKSLNASKSPGPDSIHPRILKESAEVIALPLSLIFRSSLSSGMIPEKWKWAHITPVFKKGSKHDKENYRPISLTSVICRLLERIIKNEIVKHLDANELFSNDQYGFRAKRSCVTQLLEALEEWTSLLDEGNSIDVIYFDFAKAFDSVPHQRLLSKLNSYGIRGNVLQWITAFLRDRKQRVVLNGFKSSWTNVLSGVPQGSVLGPLLFLIYINDLPDCIESSSVKIFADDLKLYQKNSGSSQPVQDDINRIENWSSQWQLPLNAQKCSKLHVSCKNGEGIDSNIYYIIDQKVNRRIEIKESEETKDLGVIIDTKLKFQKQIANCIKKANGVLASIKRTIKYLSIQTFNTLYKALVRPLLESAGAVWSPSLVKDIRSLESVQRRATKLVPSLRNLSYKDRLIALDLPTLAYRRKRGDMIMVFKIMKGIVDLHYTTFFKLSTNNTRGHELKLFKQRSRLNVRRNFFSQRIVESWNALPEQIVNCTTVLHFEKLYDRFHCERKYNF